MMTQFKHVAIPTLYRGVQFRSRLEARWAAWMDLVGLDWEYEPMDASGYIPDFLIRTDKDTELIAEVKPISFIEPGDMGDWQEAFEKIRGSGITGPALVLGSRPHRYEDVFDPSIWGFLTPEEGQYSAVIGLTQESPGHLFTGFTWPSYQRSKSLWNAAGNAVQWRAQ